MQHEGKPDDLSGRLRRVCELRGWKQKDLAELIGSNLDRVKSLMTGKAKKLDAGELEALVRQHVRREYLLQGEPPEFKTDQELALERQLQLLGQASDVVRRLDVPNWVKRTALEWVLAVQRGDSERVRELAELAAPPATAAPPLLGDERLQAVIEAVLSELVRRQVQLPPAKITGVILALLETTPADQPVNPAAVTHLVRLAA
jgi:hypothetical protein